MSLKSATATRPVSPLHTSIYIHRHHYSHLSEDSARKAGAVKQNPLRGVTCVPTWAITALCSSRLDRLTCLLSSLLNNICISPSYSGEVRQRFSSSLITAVLSFLLQSMRTPRKNSQLWSKDDWKHPEHQIKSKKIAPNLREIFFLCFTRRPPTIMDFWIKLLKFNELLPCFCGKL